MYNLIIYIVHSITGFSFGSILAQMCANHLWSLSQEISTELLERHLLCITYGQPLIQIPFAQKVADGIPKERFHSIFFVKDIAPRVMRYLDASYSTCAEKVFLRPMDADKVCAGILL